MNQPAQGPRPFLGIVDDVKKVGEFIGWSVGAVTASVAFITAQGGPVAVLKEIGVFGFSCYISAWVVIPLLALLMAGLHSATQRESRDGVIGFILSAGVLLAGSIIYFGAFVPDKFGQRVDGIGSAFLALLGISVLCVPLYFVWLRKGSTPRP